MLIATFGSTTAWSGQTISHEGDAFVIDGHGPVSADQIMEYDRRQELVWANDGTRAWVGAKAKDVPARETVVVESAAAPTGTRGSATGQDRVKEWGNLWSKTGVWTGVIVGLVAVGITWAATFLLGMIPNRPLSASLLSPAGRSDSMLDYHWWAAWSLLCHFGGSVRVAARSSVADLARGSYGFNVTGLVPVAIFVGVIFLVSIFVRRRASRDAAALLRMTLLAALTIAVVVAMVALIGGYTVGAHKVPGADLIGGDAFHYSVSFGVFSSFLRAFIISFLVGAFAFGLVERFPVPHAAALSDAARFSIAPLIVVALLFSVIAGSRWADASGSSDQWARSVYAGLASLVSPAAGAATVPMSFGAQATYGVVGARVTVVDSLYNGAAEGRTLAALLKSLSGGRILSYADQLGTRVKYAALLLVVAVLALWAYTVRRFLGVMGAPTGLAGLKAGAYIGFVSAIVVVLLALLLSVRGYIAVVDLNGVSPGAASIRFAAGITGGSYPYVLLVLTATGAVVGYLLGAFSPTPARFTMSALFGPAGRAATALPAKVSSMGRSATDAARSRSAVRPAAVGSDVVDPRIPVTAPNPEPLSPPSPATVVTPPSPAATTFIPVTAGPSIKASPSAVVPDIVGSTSPPALATTPATPTAPAGTRPAAAATSAVSSPTTIADAIAKLANLHAQGSITDEEFAAFKAKLME